MRLKYGEAEVRGRAAPVHGIDGGVTLMILRTEDRAAGLESAVQVNGRALVMRMMVVRFAPGMRQSVFGVVLSTRQEQPNPERRRRGTMQVSVNLAPDPVRVVVAMVGQVDHRGHEDLEDKEREPASAADDATT